MYSDVLNEKQRGTERSTTPRDFEQAALLISISFAFHLATLGTEMGQAGSTPVQPTAPAQAAAPPAGCPMHVDSAAAPPPPAAAAGGSCPVDHGQYKGTLNPVNNIPELAQAPSPGQRTHLPLERTISSIPRASSASSSDTPPPACPVAHGTAPATATAAKEEQWEYPSPQQFYNALVRKGWETPEESVEMMVNIHNWLNEEAWSQVRRWEERHTG